ncbi:Hypothetical predicted protein [Lecanosticta acicola]|uniref:Uncharacterized protein n=1 Tax=Lecanosticta acicola TaxID=111012 RepID=A0AAI9EB05_9PEZI|nr:Hypothetical predicted protein [Lecanosticta acicola]
MTGLKVTRKVYSAEELHRLRGSQSQPKLHEAIEEHEGEDAEIVKEHVLRGSKSFTARSTRSRTTNNSLRVPSNHSHNENVAAVPHDISRQSTSLNPIAAGHVLGEIQPNNQFPRQGPFKIGRSPTPSIKKKKAEAIVKAHGSPTHVRVTAGGRIVPSEQSPLCHPRYGYSAIKANGGLVKFAPNHHPGQPNQWIESTEATKNGSIVQDIHGNFCQIVDGIVHPLDEVDGAFRLHMEAPNVTLPRSSLGSANSSFRNAASQPQPPARPNGIAPEEPPVEVQIAALEQEYTKLDNELKEVNKTDAAHGKNMSSSARQSLYDKRRQLTVQTGKLHKTIKELKNRPPPNAPTSPRAMAKRNSISPRTRLPPFLQQRQAPGLMQIPPGSGPAPPAYGQFYGGGPSIGGQYGVQPEASPEEVYGAQPWPMPPQNMFVPPPPFDGSMLPPMSAYQHPTVNSLVVALPTVEGNIAQNDGSDEQQGDSPNRSRALSIRAPDSKPAPNLKSNLNPMSPAYKPASAVSRPALGDNTTSKQIRDRVPTPLSPLHQLQPPSQSHKTSNATDDTISPTKRAAHLQSSSISSFDTADFFPRNTREYSTRQYVYQGRTDQSEDKENANPESSTAERDVSPTTPGQNNQSSMQATKDYTPQTCGFKAPAAPPGTPVHAEGAGVSRASVVAPPSRIDVPNREADNISPKSKREWYFVQEHPEQVMKQSFTSPEKIRVLQDELEVTNEPEDTIDFTQKPRDWIQGYQAGLQRKAVSAAHSASFMDGYCAGMLKSEEANNSSTKTAQATGSPYKSVSRRPSPAIPSHSSGRTQLAENASSGPRPPFEKSTNSMDCLKQAVFAPQNKNAVLTPAPDGPHVSEAPLNLGAWQKSQQGPTHLGPTTTTRIASYHLPLRTSSNADQQRVMSDGHVDNKQQSTTSYLHLTGQPASPSLSTMSIASSSIPSNSAPNTDKRITSITSLDATMYRQWPGSRIMTPTEWKTESSVAHAAGLATGYFANAQFDGANPPQRTTTVASNADNPQLSSRFREGSLDRMSDPPTSPPPPMSPNLSPAKSPRRQNSARKAGTPGKTQSPTKAKIEHIAGKVGIKVSGSPGKANEGATGAPNFDSSSPPDKRRWRDIWRKGGHNGSE